MPLVPCHKSEEMEPARYPQAEEWILKMCMDRYIDIQWDFTLSLRKIKL